MGDTLLLVDDDQSVLRAIGDYFERLGYEVLREATGDTGVETFKRVHPDVVILDLNLPDASGLVVLERLRRENGAVILLTGAGDIQTAVRAAAVVQAVATVLDAQVIENAAQAEAA